jgi:hypothetical protein
MYRVRDVMGREQWVEVAQPVDSDVTGEDVPVSALEEDDLEESSGECDDTPGFTASSQKLEVYGALYSLNQGFEHVLRDLRRLREFPFLRPQLLDVLNVIVQETRAWANFEAIEVLQSLEQNDWAKYGRIHRRWEKKYQDPNDILIEAEKLKRKRTRQQPRNRS